MEITSSTRGGSSDLASLSLASLCGQLLVVGYQGALPSPSLLAALEAGECGGFIVFKRNLALEAEGRARVEALAGALAELARRAPAGLPPLLAVDQEGGRVARLGPPVLSLPPMRALAAVDGDGEDLARRAGRALGEELQAIGFTMDFAPILDVDSNPDNPIIGDRAFGREPAAAATLALAFGEGLREGGLLACGKHFPGHGDTLTDSHLELPVVSRSRDELEATELPPFRRAARAPLAVPALMTAHVLYPALDGVPATLSRAIATDLLRGDLGFEGVLISDDLEMKALHDPVERTAVGAVRAGCDLLLVCSDEALYARAKSALVAEAAADPAFRARCEEALARGLAMRRACPPRVASAEARTALFERHGALRVELARRLGGAK
ncbi:MAG TPA: beta-N-acetylhexosaminidase [Polyangiaceae bacterium]|nr:beta-N-acetylhexosaminidase [Polyangiaceae bacterium]